MDELFRLPIVDDTVTIIHRRIFLLKETSVEGTLQWGYTLDPPSNLKVYSAGVTVTVTINEGRSDEETLGIPANDFMISATAFSYLASLTASTVSTLTVSFTDSSGAAHPVRFTVGTVKGGVIGTTRVMSVDELGRLILTKGETVVCEPTYEIQPGDIVSVNGLLYHVDSAALGRDVHGKVHHYELSVTPAGEEVLR